jgi:hypothetical protein
MHNDRMIPRSRTRVAAAVLAALVAASLVGCSGEDDPDTSPESERPTPSASASPYLPVPEGVTLTPPGTHLSVGDSGVVAYEPRQDVVGVLDLNVTKIEQTTTKDTMSAWQLTPAQRASTPYFVHVSATNVGETDLGGRPVPLYAVNEDNLLLEATPFASSFAPCPSTPFPKPFGPAATADLCLVFLAPEQGTLEAVSFRPVETFDPIIWTGGIETYVAPKPEKPKKKKKNQNG